MPNPGHSTHSAEKCRSGWEGVGNDPDEMVRIRDEVQEKYVQDEAVEAASISAAGINARRRQDKPPTKKGGGQQASSSASANARGIFTAPVGRCWH